MTAATLALLAVPPDAPNEATLPLLLVALAALAVLATAEHHRPSLDRRRLLWWSAALVAVAVAAPPHGSRDVWSYALYGRILGVHHRNPYVAAPSAFGADPFLARLSPAWRSTRSVYGPLFTLLSTVIALAAGTSAIVARLLFQLVAGAALLAVVALLGRAGTRSSLLVLVALNPLFVVTVVNAGHNDALVALGILGAALLARRQRPALAGLVVALAASVKISALLAAAALAIWWWRRAQTRAGLTVLGVSVGLTAAFTVVFGLRAPLVPLRAASRHVNGPSAWRLILAATTRPGHSLPGGLAALAEVVVGMIALGTCLAASRGSRDGGRRGTGPDVGTGSDAGAAYRPAAVVAIAFGAYLLAAPYIMPWYLAWVLPVAVASDDTWLSVLLAADAAVLMVAAQYHGVIHPDLLDQALGAFRVVAEVLAVVGTGALVLRVARRRPAIGPAA